MHAILVGESRFRPFTTRPVLSMEAYHLHIICIIGGVVKTVKDNVLKLLARIRPTDLCFLYLDEGVNELTKHERHENETELVPNYQSDVLAHLLSSKKDISSRHPNTVVGIATIAAINFTQANNHYLRRGKLFEAKYNTGQRQRHQQEFDEVWAWVNHNLICENAKPEFLPRIGMIWVPQLYLHQNVEKFALIKKGKKLIPKCRLLIITALVDGIHQNNQISGKWYKMVSVEKNIETLQDTI
jgi:hypothetical protein